METKQFGNTDMNITRTGFGAWAIGGGNWEYAWGPQDDGEAIAAIRRAIDNGMNWIDTAAVYGLGHSEELVGGCRSRRTPSFSEEVFERVRGEWRIGGWRRSPAPR